MQAGLAAVCFVTRGDEILLMECHARSFAPGRWSVIGGRFEPGETPEQAVRREVWEESGLQVGRCRQVGQVLVYEPGGSVTSLYLFRTSEWQGELRGSSEGQPVWVPLAEAGELPLVGYLRLLLPLVLEPHAVVLGTIHTVAMGDVASHRLWPSAEISGESLEISPTKA